MKNFIIYSLILIFCITVYNLNNRIDNLSLRLSRVEKNKLTKVEAETKLKLISLQMKDKAASVLSIRCKDSSKNEKGEPKTWNGTATKISDKGVLTAHHLITDQNDEKNRKGPISCEFFSKGIKIGTSKSDKQTFRQVGNRDLALVAVEFTKDGNKIPNLSPMTSPSAFGVGDMLILITHPRKFINDWIITYGYILKEDTSKILTAARSDYWKNSILTDMSAAPGSSGSPLFNLDGDFIGIHVGGEREQGLNVNYQILFDGELLLAVGLFNMFTASP